MVLDTVACMAACIDGAGYCSLCASCIDVAGLCNQFTVGQMISTHSLSLFYKVSGLKVFKVFQNYCCAIAFVLLLVRSGAFVAHWYIYVPRRCRTSHSRNTLNPISVSLWKYLGKPVLHCMALGGSKSGADVFYWPKRFTPFLTSAVFPISFFFLQYM